jgi:hypothetical protein
MGCPWCWPLRIDDVACLVDTDLAVIGGRIAGKSHRDAAWFGLSAARLGSPSMRTVPVRQRDPVGRQAVHTVTRFSQPRVQ